MKNRIQSINTLALLPLAGAVLLIGCASTVPQQPAGTAPKKMTSSERWKAQGGLKVYTTQRWKDIDEQPSYVHATYRLLTAEGRYIMKVLNVGPMGEPEAVRLAPGSYIVEARAYNPAVVKLPPTHGAVRIPVTVETGMTTVVHLDKQD